MTSEDEGLPYALLEAKSCEIPAVAFSVGGINEVIRDNVDGFVVPFGEINNIVSSLNRLLDDKNLKYKMGELSREDVINRFSISIMQDRTIQAFKNFGINLY